MLLLLHPLNTAFLSTDLCLFSGLGQMERMTSWRQGLLSVFLSFFQPEDLSGSLKKISEYQSLLFCWVLFEESKSKMCVFPFIGNEELKSTRLGLVHYKLDYLPIRWWWPALKKVVFLHTLRKRCMLLESGHHVSFRKDVRTYVTRYDGWKADKSRRAYRFTQQSKRIIDYMLPFCLWW